MSSFEGTRRQFFSTRYGNITQQKLEKITASFTQGNQFRADVSLYKFIPIFLVGLLGNMTIIVYFLKIYGWRRIRKISNYHFLIILLAMVDLVVIILNTVDTTVLKLRITARDVDKISIVSSIILQKGSNTTSCWLLVILSYERYRSIVHPFNVSLKKRFILMGFLLIWVACLLVNWPVFMTFYIGRSPGAGLEGDESLLYSIIPLMLDCVLPSTVLVFYNWQISRYLKKNTFPHYNNETAVNEAPPAVSSTVKRDEATSSNRSSSSQCRRNKKNETANKTLRNLVIIYICCVWPGRLINNASFFVIKYNTLFYFENYVVVCVVEESLDFLMFLNNVINVFVYAVLIPKFRSFLLKLFTCGACRGS